ncbi:hypothetical protein Hypma_002281 [Hypsizygus marmoreus]|uniref:F-box domain-containing protein n=1 Tax=Hypsizygus marmoreus TaxID=39966 RepID=A0A369JZN3_HYPMA|nr:hypothetical protein Hypma_002281 [Hypsizygus marmoreus]
MVLSTPIPVDIIMQIVNEVPFNLKYLLLECSTISHAFASACQRRLFATVEIGSFRGRERCQQLYGLLKDSPHLASFVRNLTLQNGWNRMPSPSGGGVKVEWLLVEQTLPPLLDMLPALHSVNLKSSSKPMVWSTLSHDLQTSFLRVFALPCLTRIRFSHVTFPAGVLSCCTNVVDLDLYRSSIVDEIDETMSLYQSPTFSKSAKPSIRRLSVTGPVPPGELLESVLDITPVQVFNLVDPYDHALAAELTRCFVSSLKQFVWTIPEVDHFSQTLNLTSFSFSHNLRSVEIRLKDQISSEQLDPLISALHALSRLDTGPVSLEEFMISMNYRSGLMPIPWRTLDSILSERSVFTNLRRARFVFFALPFGSHLATGLGFVIARSMPGLRKLGILSVVDACRSWPTSPEGWESDASFVNVSLGQESIP